MATPKFNPGTGTNNGTQSVTISDATSGATIYYTTNGSPPSPTNGNKYSTTLTVGGSETVKAIAVLAGYTESEVATTGYTIE